MSIWKALGNGLVGNMLLVVQSETVEVRSRPFLDWHAIVCRRTLESREGFSTTMGLLLLMPVLLLQGIVAANDTCSSTCYSSSCDDMTRSGVACDILESLFSCDCTGCLCNAQYDPGACVDIPNFEDSKGRTCADYSANPTLCVAAQDFMLSGSIPATSACCVCQSSVTLLNTYFVPIQAQQVVEGDTGNVNIVSDTILGGLTDLDNSCWRINVTEGTPVIFGAPQTEAYVCANGVVSFGSPLLSVSAKKFPATTMPAVAPFWADVDVRCGTSTLLSAQSGCGGGSYYWQFITPSTDYSEFLSVVDGLIRQLYDPLFSAGSLLVGTWDAVGSSKLNTEMLNTFQVVVATSSDGSGDTYACFAYESMEWSVSLESTLNYAQVGFDAGDGVRSFSFLSSASPTVATDLMSMDSVPCYKLSEVEVCDVGFSYIDGQCTANACTEYAAGWFSDRYLTIDCGLPVESGSSCSLACTNGKIAMANAILEATCIAGRFEDPGSSCVEPGIAVVPSRLNLIEGNTGVFSLGMLSSVFPNMPLVLVPNITLLSEVSSLGAGPSMQGTDYVQVIGNSFGTPSTSEGHVLFNAENYVKEAMINISALDNVYITGTVSVIVNFNLYSLDPGFEGYTPPSLIISIEDNDIAGVVIETQGDLQVLEMDEEALGISACDSNQASSTVIEYSLESQPSADVSITFGTDDDELGVVCERSTLVFTETNWNQPQPLRVAVVSNDRDDSGFASPDVPKFTVMGAIRTSDPNYQPILTTTGVAVTYIDNDHSGLTVAAAGVLEASEGGAGIVGELVLDSEPFGDVLLLVAVNDTRNCMISAGEVLTFTQENWDTSR